MADLSPQDIKDPDDPDFPPPTPPPGHEPPDDDEDEDDEDEDEAPKKKGKPDLAAAAKHLVVAVGELAKQSGSHPAVVAALDKARAALGE